MCDEACGPKRRRVRDEGEVDDVEENLEEGTVLWEDLGRDE